MVRHGTLSFMPKVIAIYIILMVCKIFIICGFWFLLILCHINYSYFTLRTKHSLHTLNGFTLENVLRVIYVKERSVYSVTSFYNRQCGTVSGFCLLMLFRSFLTSLFLYATPVSIIEFPGFFRIFCSP